MHITDIKIQNFRIFDNFQITLNKSINIFVGENNSGKTALIDAIRYALDTNSAEWIKIKSEDFHNQTDNLLISIKFVEIEDFAHKFVEHITYMDDKPVLYVNLICKKTEIERNGQLYIKTDIKSGVDGDGLPIEREIRDFLSTTYLKPLRDAENELSARKGSRLSQILLGCKDLKHTEANRDNIKKIIDALVTANQEIKGSNGIQKTQKDIVDEYFKKLIFNTDNLSAIIEIIGDKKYDDMNETERKYVLKTILEKLSLNFCDCKGQQGLGYNNILFIATELLLLEQDRNQNLPILLIEEPEAHLHPQLQMKLLDFIKDKSKTSNSVQAIVSTHSPNLASKANLSSLFLMKGGRAFSLREGETCLAPDDYVFLEKFLDVTKANLFFARSIIMVEGDGEEIVLPTMAELLGIKLEDYGISIINVKNTAFHRYAKIFQRNPQEEGKEVEEKDFINIKVACLRDLDLWPQDAKYKDKDGNIINEFGINDEKSGNNGTGRTGVNYWLSASETERQEQIRHKEKKLKEIEGQNVKVFVSDDWTFEYSLIKAGLGKEIFETYTIPNDDETIDSLFSAITGTEEQKAVKIFKEINKTECAYKLCTILTRDYTDKKEEFIAKLPKYIKDMFEYIVPDIFGNKETESEIRDIVDANNG